MLACGRRDWPDQQVIRSRLIDTSEPRNVRRVRRPGYFAKAVGEAEIALIPVSHPLWRQCPGTPLTPTLRVRRAIRAWRCHLVRASQLSRPCVTCGLIVFEQHPNGRSNISIGSAITRRHRPT
jgi:hypothetical protein